MEPSVGHGDPPARVAADSGHRLVVRAGIFGLPVVGDVICPARLDVAVEAVGADVELAAGEPGHVGRVAPVEDRVPGSIQSSFSAQLAHQPSGSASACS